MLEGARQKKAGARKGKAAVKGEPAATAEPAAAAAPEPVAAKPAAPKAAGGGGAAAGKAGGKEKDTSMLELMHIDPSARVDVDTNDLIDIGELDMDDIGGLNDDEIDGFFSPAAGGGGKRDAMGDLGDLDDMNFGDLDGNLDACFASTPRAAEPGVELRMGDSTLPEAVRNELPVDVDEPLEASAPGSLMEDAPPGVGQPRAAHDAAALEAARKAEEAKDLEILAKPMTQLPPVARRLGGLWRRGMAASSGFSSAVPNGVPVYHLSLVYGPSRVAANPPAPAHVGESADVHVDGKIVIKVEDGQHSERDARLQVGAHGSGMHPSHASNAQSARRHSHSAASARLPVSCGKESELLRAGVGRRGCGAPHG